MKQQLPQQTLLIASTGLKGPAKVSGRQLKEENPNCTFKELTDKLETKFAGTDYLLQLKGKLCNIKQKNQTAAQLIDALDDAFWKAKVTNDGEECIYLMQALRD